jgi:signal transduction histidine kinase
VELQESLRRSETMSAMGTIVAGVAHEVRNPLFGISATLDAFHEELSQPGYQDCADALRTEVKRLQKVMQELLEYGKPSTLNIQRGGLETIVKEAIAHRKMAGVTVETFIPADLPDLLADRDRLRQVFENLVDNASRFSSPGGSVTLTASVVQHFGRRWIECSVEDSGPGFASEDLDRVFEPFFSRREGGTGLGLSIVQRIVQDHSGRVFAENRDEGGARVRILLPIADRALARP